MIYFDHQKLVNRQPRELKRFRRYLLSVTAGEMAEEASICHEDDGSCCRREPWNVTATRIVLAVKPPTPIMMVNTNRPD